MSSLLGILALGELHRADSDARRAGKEMSALKGELKKLETTHAEFVFKAKSHVHGVRSAIHAHIVTEDMLIAALQAENANHPLASREAIDAAVESERVKALTNPDVIKRTYPNANGVLPADVIGGDPPQTYGIA